MAKYHEDRAGSSCHIHISLWKDDENAFAEKVNWAIQNPHASAEIGDRAQAFIRDKYNSRLIAESLLDAYRYVTSDAYTPIR